MKLSDFALNEIERQLDGSEPYYVRSLIAAVREARAERAAALDTCVDLMTRIVAAVSAKTQE